MVEEKREEEKDEKRDFLNHSLLVQLDSEFGRSSDIVRVPVRALLYDRTTHSLRCSSGCDLVETHERPGNPNTASYICIPARISESVNFAPIPNREKAPDTNKGHSNPP